MSKKTVISKSELNSVIMETIYEMLEDGDSGLISLMMESERLNGDVEENVNEWLERTKAVLQESLGMDPEEKAVEVISEEMTKMLHLADITEEA